MRHVATVGRPVGGSGQLPATLLASFEAAGGTLRTKSFVDKIVKVAKEQGSARVVNDQEGSPTYAKDLALPIIAIIEKQLTGIVHVANGGSCSWYEFAKEIFSLKNMDVQVSPITSRELGRAAPRPSYSVFDLSRLERDAGIGMRHWREALREYLASTD